MNWADRNWGGGGGGGGGGRGGGGGGAISAIAVPHCGRVRRSSNNKKIPVMATQ